MMALRLSVLTISLTLTLAGLGSQAALGQAQEPTTGPSPASKDAILLLRDLLAQNGKLDSKQKDHLKTIKPGSLELSELATKFEKKYSAENNCKPEVCLSSDTLASFLQARKSTKAHSGVTIDLRKSAERRSALLALQFVEDAQHIDPTAEPSYPWCLLTGNC